LTREIHAFIHIDNFTTFLTFGGSLKKNKKQYEQSGQNNQMNEKKKTNGTIATRWP
jgi:hypothetical protein